jgi:hypothetical protein
MERIVGEHERTQSLQGGIGLRRPERAKRLPLRWETRHCAATLWSLLML